MHNLLPLDPLGSDNSCEGVPLNGKYQLHQYIRSLGLFQAIIFSGLRYRLASSASLGEAETAVSSDDLEGSFKNATQEISTKACLREFVTDNLGLLLIGAAQLFFSSMDVAVQVLHGIDPPVTTFQLVLVRMGLTYIFSMIYMLAAKIENPWFGPKEVCLLLLLRGLGGFVGLSGLYYSLEYLSLSDATVLTFLTPIFIGISTALLLGEPYTLVEGLAGVASLFGVILIARPGPLSAHNGEDDSLASVQERLTAIGIGLIGVMGATCAYTCIRAIGHRAHVMHSMVAYSLIAAVSSSIAMAIRGEHFIIPSKPEWLGLFFMIGGFGFGASILLTIGLQRGKAARSTIAIYIQIVFAVILEKIIFGTTPPSLSILGIVIIISSALYVALTKQKKGAIRLEDEDENFSTNATEGQ